MKVAAWNVNSIRARLPLVLQWIQDAKPDILLLQETKVENAAFPYEPFEDLGFNLALYGQKSYHGVAIASRFPIEDIQRGLPTFSTGEGAGEARYLEVFTGGMRMASVYAPNGESVGHAKYKIKEAFFAALSAHVDHLLSLDDMFLLGGDYNIAPTEADVYDAELWKDRILCSDDERKWWRRLIGQGLHDPLQKSVTRDTQNIFTWWDYRTNAFKNDRGLRIDHLLLSPRAAECLKHVDVAQNTRAWARPSDHAPVIGTFEVTYR